VRTDELRLLLSRIRWVNLAGVLGLPALVLAIVLWPRLAPSPPVVPDAAPRPLVAEPAAGRAARPARRADAGAARSGPRGRASPSTRRAGGRQPGGGR
jgi:hypothetical protein